MLRCRPARYGRRPRQSRTASSIPADSRMCPALQSVPRSHPLGHFPVVRAKNGEQSLYQRTIWSVQLSFPPVNSFLKREEVDRTVGMNRRPQNKMVEWLIRRTYIVIGSVDHRHSSDTCTLRPIWYRETISGLQTKAPVVQKNLLENVIHSQERNYQLSSAHGAHFRKYFFWFSSTTKLYGNTIYFFSACHF